MPFRVSDLDLSVMDLEVHQRLLYAPFMLCDGLQNAVQRPIGGYRHPCTCQVSRLHAEVDTMGPGLKKRLAG